MNSATLKPRLVDARSTGRMTTPFSVYGLVTGDDRDHVVTKGSHALLLGNVLHQVIVEVEGDWCVGGAGTHVETQAQAAGAL